MMITIGKKGSRYDFKYSKAFKQAFAGTFDTGFAEPKAGSVRGAGSRRHKDRQQGFGAIQSPRFVVRDCDTVMKTFKTFLREGSYPLWTKAVTAGLVLKVRNLSKQIEQEPDLAKQNLLIGQQNKLLAYRNGLGIAVSTKDQQLMTSVRSKLG